MAINDTEQKRFLSLLEIVQREGIWLLKTNTAAEWLDVLNLRNKLIHEYIADAEEYAVIDLYMAHDGLFDYRTYEVIDNSIFHKLQIPPSPPFSKWGNDSILNQAGSPLCKGGLGGILNVMNYIKLNNSAHVFVQLLVAVYNAINIFANSRIAAADWPKLLPAHNNHTRISQ